MFTPIPSNHPHASLLPNKALCVDILTTPQAKRYAKRRANACKALKNICILCLDHDDTVRLVQIGNRGGIQKTLWNFGKAASAELTLRA